jgi:hypothetical protein
MVPGSSAASLIDAVAVSFRGASNFGADALGGTALPDEPGGGAGDEKGAWAEPLPGVVEKVGKGEYELAMGDEEK